MDKLIWTVNRYHIFESDKIRFMKFIRKEMRNDGIEHWIWQGGKLKEYGSFSINQKTISAHRAAWLIFNGEIPDKTPNVLHHCDIELCVNPFICLFLGTEQDNVDDMVNKRRNTNSVPAEVIMAIIAEYEANPGIIQCELARRYGVNQSTVSRLINKKRRFSIDF